MEFKENVIEWITGDDSATVSLSQKKYINRVRRLAEKYPSMVRIKAENKDGSICARISLSAVRLSIFSTQKGALPPCTEDAEKEEKE